MNTLLLPYRWRYVSIPLIIAGIILCVMYTMFDFVLKVPVFAVYSAFLETKLFVSFTTNFADELTMILLVGGLGLFIFSKEKKEDSSLDLLRSNALSRAAFVNTILLLFSILFVYGTGFLAVLVFNVFSMMLLYLVFFYQQKRKLNTKLG